MRVAELRVNVFLGHLIPAGAGFRTHQEAEVRLNATPLSFGRQTGPAAEAEAQALEPAGK